MRCNVEQLWARVRREADSQILRGEKPGSWVPGLQPPLPGRRAEQAKPLPLPLSRALAVFHRGAYLMSVSLNLWGLLFITSFGKATLKRYQVTL